MTVNTSKLQPVTVSHPRIPYKLTPAVAPHDGDPVCIVALTGGFFRVIHLKSGVTLTDTRNIVAANKFVKAIRQKYKGAGFKRKLDAVSWVKFCQHVRGKNDPTSAWLLRVLDYASSAEDNVPYTTTKNERYFYPPEPIS